MARNFRSNAHRIAGLLFGAVLFSLSLPVAQAHACACCGTFRVINVESWDVLNVRSGPGVHFQIVYKLPYNEGCIRQTGERKGVWVHIEFADVSGWVNSHYLAYTP